MSPETRELPEYLVGWSNGTHPVICRACWSYEELSELYPQLLKAGQELFELRESLESGEVFPTPEGPYTLYGPEGEAVEDHPGFKRYLLERYGIDFYDWLALTDHGDFWILVLQRYGTGYRTVSFRELELWGLE